MSVLSTTITSLCLGLPPTQQLACVNGLTALSKENATDKMLDLKEQEIDKDLLQDAYNTFGKNGTIFLGGGLYLVKIVQDRGVSFNLPTLGICDSVNNVIGVDNYVIRLEWRL